MRISADKVLSDENWAKWQTLMVSELGVAKGDQALMDSIKNRVNALGKQYIIESQGNIRNVPWNLPKETPSEVERLCWAVLSVAALEQEIAVDSKDGNLSFHKITKVSDLVGKEELKKFEKDSVKKYKDEGLSPELSRELVKISISCVALCIDYLNSHPEAPYFAAEGASMAGVKKFAKKIATENGFVAKVRENEGAAQFYFARSKEELNKIKDEDPEDVDPSIYSLMESPWAMPYRDEEWISMIYRDVIGTQS